MTLRISREDQLMWHALVASSRGTCSRLQVGVVIARHGRILVTGYNGAPAGMEHCDHTCACDHRHSSMGGLHANFCPAELPCMVSVHAECNAIAYAARWGISIARGVMVTTDSPCLSCAQLVINSGIEEVIYAREYRDTSGLDLVRNAGLEVSCLPLTHAIA